MPAPAKRAALWTVVSITCATFVLTDKWSLHVHKLKLSRATEIEMEENHKYEQDKANQGKVVQAKIKQLKTQEFI
ncbi:hypothetical protein MKW98_008898 [Papaver atlanticum]|uniref:Uncharacterized protein n=1 Tax=Papaver atlanticum TaxID=357466 RepID=A0AAD4S3D9_9MAGN|nr:hypothetical protein MKW98_008898 [Papaver atlanticum]